jgi:hypothetical protein
MVARENFTFSDLENWFNERRVTEIECLVPDLTGVARGKILPREKFTEDRGMRLPEAIVAIGVTGEFPAEGPYYDVIHATDRDMHLRPDPSTVRIVPWATDPTAQVIHDCFDRDGVMIPYAPRSVLRRICDLYDAEGWAPVVAPELEFYLIERNADPNTPLRPPKGRSGRAETSRQAYSIDAVNEFDPLFEDIYAYCEKMELNVDTLIHEVGAGQMEINFFHDHPLGLADEVFFFKRTIREAAMRHEMYATFMAKPMSNEQCHARAPERDQQGHRQEHLQQPRWLAIEGVLLVHRRAAEVHASGHGAARTIRQFVPSTRPLDRRADQHPVGHRQPDGWHPFTGGNGCRTTHRKPGDRCRREPLRRLRSDLGLRLPGHQEQGRAGQ